MYPKFKEIALDTATWTVAFLGAIEERETKSKKPFCTFHLLDGDIAITANLWNTEKKDIYKVQEKSVISVQLYKKLYNGVETYEVKEYQAAPDDAKLEDYLLTAPIPSQDMMDEIKSFYPDPLSKQEKYWLNKLGAIIEAVPGNPQNPQKCLYPQGRALQNFPNADWNVIGPKCANCRLLTLQNVNSISQMVTCLLQHGKVCTPVIAPNGGIKLGESALCPEVSNIYKSEAAIIQDIRQCTCQKCEIAWDNLKKVHPTAYYLCGGK